MSQRDDGLERLRELSERDAARAQNRQRQELYNRLHVTLMQVPWVNREETRLWLPELERLDTRGRREAILQRFGQQVLQRCEPALLELQRLGL